MQLEPGAFLQLGGFFCWRHPERCVDPKLCVATAACFCRLWQTDLLTCQGYLPHLRHICQQRAWCKNTALSGCCLCAGDFAELSLNFTATVVEHSANGRGTRQREIELKPGGRDTPVKADNVIEYIHRLADFRLNRQMDRAAAAFLRGFFELIKPRWVRMFNEAELQMLISGSEEGIDVDDLMNHISYAGTVRARVNLCCLGLLPLAVKNTVASSCTRHSAARLLQLAFTVFHAQP